jgi:hypothetical protein
MTIANRSKRTIGTRKQRGIVQAAKKQCKKNQRAIDSEVTRTGLEYAAMMINALHAHTPVITPVTVAHQMVDDWSCYHSAGELVRGSGMELVGYSYMEQECDGFVWPIEHVFIARDHNALSHIIPVTYKSRTHKARTELLCNAHRVELGLSNQELA